MSRHCTVIIQVGHCIVPVKCQIDRPVLQFYMSDIACGSAPQDFKEIFRENFCLHYLIRPENEFYFFHLRDYTTMTF